MIALLLVLIASYSVNPAAGNQFTLQVAKTGLMKGKKHLFSFSKYTGSLEYDSKSAIASKVEFALDGTSMVCEDTWVKDSDRDKILDWGLNKMIEVSRYPDIRFVSGKINQTGPTHFQVFGSLTIRGISRQTMIAVTADGLNMDGTSTIDMRNWGMKPPTAALGAVGTSPEMLVHFHLIFTPSR